MEQPLPATHSLRTGENARRSGYNSQVQTNRKKVPRGSAPNSQPNARQQGKRLETAPDDWRPEVGEETKRYFMRCPELGMHDWELTTGPSSIYAAVRMKLARADHDAAFPVSIGHKKITMEVRYANSSNVMRFECEGRFIPKYQCDRVN